MIHFLARSGDSLGFNRSFTRCIPPNLDDKFIYEPMYFVYVMEYVVFVKVYSVFGMI